MHNDLSLALGIAQFFVRYCGLIGIFGGIAFAIWGDHDRGALLGSGAAVVIGLALHWRTYGPTVSRHELGRLSVGWKLYLLIYRGIGLALTSLTIALYTVIRWSEADPLMVCVGIFGIGGWSAWFWMRQYPIMRPIFGHPAAQHDEISGPDLEKMRLLDENGSAADNLGSLFGGMVQALQQMDVDSAAAVTAPSGASGQREFHTSANERVVLASDGSVYLNGKFVGHRGTGGRIIDGGGTFVGTIKGDGALHAANGTYVGRIFY